MFGARYTLLISTNSTSDTRLCTSNQLVLVMAVVCRRSHCASTPDRLFILCPTGGDLQYIAYATPGMLMSITDVLVSIRA